MKASLTISFFGSSLISAYWNGAATYYRGLIKALHQRGHRTTFYEPDAFDRQRHRDITDPEYARVVVYPCEHEQEVLRLVEEAGRADVIVKASGVGIFDELLERAVLDLKAPASTAVFWDVDAPATLDRVLGNPDEPFRRQIPRYDLILTYGGGDSVVRRYLQLGARQCVPVYNALDPSTHFRNPADNRFEGALGFLGHRLPDRESRVEEFFFRPARLLARRRFVLGGTGWQDRAMPKNVNYLGHIYTGEHNAFNSTPLAVLNVNRMSMARYGFSPPTRIFEAAGAAACLISDCWEGIETFLEPGCEVLLAGSGDDVAEHLRALTPARARKIGAAARRHILADHTYTHRAEQVEDVFVGCIS